MEFSFAFCAAMFHKILSSSAGIWRSLSQNMSNIYGVVSHFVLDIMNMKYNKCI